MTSTMMNYGEGLNEIASKNRDLGTGRVAQLVVVTLSADV